MEIVKYYFFNLFYLMCIIDFMQLIFTSYLHYKGK